VIITGQASNGSVSFGESCLLVFFLFFFAMSASKYEFFETCTRMLTSHPLRLHRTSISFAIDRSCSEDERLELPSLIPSRRLIEWSRAFSWSCKTLIIISKASIFSNIRSFFPPSCGASSIIARESMDKEYCSLIHFS